MDYNLYRGGEEKKKKGFKQKKENTLKSLKEVEYFLRNFKDKYKYVKLYKIFK